MKLINTFKYKSRYFWVLLITIMCIFTLIYLEEIGNIDQVYDDIVVEYTAQIGSNKTAEMHLIYILVLGGSMLCALYYIFFAGKPEEKQIGKPRRLGRTDCPDDEEGKLSFFLCGVCSVLLLYYFFYQGLNQILLVSAVFAAILLFWDKKLVVPGLCYFYTAVYAVIGVYRIYAFLGGTGSINSMTIALVVIISALVPLAGDEENRRSVYVRMTLIAQLFIPGVMLLFVQSKYSYNGSIVELGIPSAVGVFTVATILFMVIESMEKLYRCWNKDDVNACICLGSCMAIMIFNRFSGTGAVIPTNMRSNYESIIGFSQIFELGQIPFKEYIPVSGMYSVIHGAFVSLIGGGEVANFYAATNVFFSLIVVAVVLILSRHIDRSILLFVSLFLLVADYNRYTFILPIMLLLASPKLIDNSNLWLKLWLLTSLFHGLYYPVYGAAVCVAFLPLGIWQIKTFVTSGKLRCEIKRARFWGCWGVCILAVILCIPLLWGTLKHTVAMANQTILADGLSRFGQVIPSSLTQYLGDWPAIRIILSLVLTFIVPALYVWVSLSLSLKASGTHVEGRHISVAQPKVLCIGVAMAIVAPIAYTYSFVRLDKDSLFVRSYGVLVAGAVMLIAYAYRYVEERHTRIWAYLVAFSIFVLSFSLGITGNESKLTATYRVPEGYVYVDKEPVERIGTGFLSESIYQLLQSQWETTKGLDQERSYLGEFPVFGSAYIMGLKGASTIEITTIRGYGAALETVEILRKTNAIVGTSANPIINYYFYNWLLTSGEYCWSDELRVFVPAGDGLDKDMVRQCNKNTGLGVSSSLGQDASSLGSSWDSLAGIFSDPGIVVDIQDMGTSAEVSFSRTIDGDDADYLYLEFDDMERTYRYILYDYEHEYVQDANSVIRFFSKIRYNPDDYVLVEWIDDNGVSHSMRCAMGKGKLLIPLGAGVNWLLHSHDSLTITVERNGEQVELPEIIEARMVKVREVEQ